MARSVAWNGSPGTPRKAAKAGKQQGGVLDRKVVVRLVAPAISVADDKATANRPGPRQQQPAADRKATSRGVADIEDMPVPMRCLAPPQYRFWIGSDGAAIAGFPERVETWRRWRWPDRQQVVDKHAVGRVEVEGVSCRNAHANGFPAEWWLMQVFANGRFFGREDQRIGYHVGAGRCYRLASPSVLRYSTQPATTKISRANIRLSKLL